MGTRQGLSSHSNLSAKKSPVVSEPLYSLTGLADNTVLADQIICVAKKWLERECLTPDINQRNNIMESDCAAEIHSIYNQIPWRTRQGSLKTNYDNIGINYQDGTIRDFCAMFVYVVWYQATYCLGGVDGNEDMYLYKSSRVYDDTFSMRLGTISSGKTKVDRYPAPGAAFVRRRDNLNPASGHAGIVVSVEDGKFTCIEGNGSQTEITGQPFEMRTYTNGDIVKYSMYFLHIEETPVINAAYPREDGYCCAPKQREEEQIGPCSSAAKPDGDGWYPTNTDIFQSIIIGGNPVLNAQFYTNQGLEFSPEWCWMRTKPTVNPALNADCSTVVCPNGYKKRKQATSTTTKKTGGAITVDPVTGETRLMTQFEVCCEPIVRTAASPCPDVAISKTSCTTAVRVSASTFDAKSVPHYSVLYKNRLMAADITGSKWTFQTVGPKNGEGLGSALNLPAPKFTNVDGDAIPDTAYSGFGTFSDVNGNLIVICPEWQSARLNSLIGNDKHASLLGSAGYYQVNCPAITGGGAVHAQAIDAGYIAGYTESIDGMVPVFPATNSNGLVDFKRDANGMLTKDMFGNYVRDKWVNENLFPGATKLPFDLSWTSIVSNNNDYTGLLNQIELNPDKNPRGKLSKPILIVLKSAPPPFDWLNFVKTVVTIAAGFAPMVGLPPQVFTQALDAINTVENIAKGGNVLNDIIKLGGLVSALLPEDLRGDINSMVGDAGKTILGESGISFFDENSKLVGKYLADGQNFLNGLNRDAVGAMVSLGFPKTSADTLIQKFFGTVTNATIKNFKPSWYDFASDYSKSLGKNFDTGFQSGVKLLHSIESIQTTQNFGRYSDSGKFNQDIINNGTALESTQFQNLMIGGLAGTVLSVTPNITLSLAAIMNKTNDILQAGKFDGDTNIGEFASVLKVANGFMANPKDFERLTLQSLSLKLEGLKDKVTKFVLPPSLTQEQQECWAKELNSCFGIEIIGNGFSYKNESKSNSNPPPVKVPPCIRTVNGSFMYCPPTTCKTGLNDIYNPGANYELRCTKISQSVQEIFNNATQSVDKYGNAIYMLNGVNYLYFGSNEGLNSPYSDVAKDAVTGQKIELYGSPNGYICELVEVAPTPVKSTPTKTTQPVTAITTTSQTPAAPVEQPCTVMYPARVSPGVPDRWYAQIAGQWVEIIDCCPNPDVAAVAGKDCCDETQVKLNQMKLDLAKVIELVGRNQAGEKCPECDLSEIKRMIANIQFPQQKTYDDAPLREEMRTGFAEIRAMIGQMKQYDVSKDLNEIKDLIKAIKIADTQAIGDEVKELRRMIETLVGQKSATFTRPDGGTSQPVDTTYFDAKWNELKELIISKNTIYQRDYSGELAQIQRDLDYFKTEFAKTKSTITTEISTTTSPEVKQDLSKLLTEQTALFNKKISDLEAKLTKPCEECTEIAKLQSQIFEMKNLILAIKPGTNTTTIKEVSNPSDKTEIERLTKELGLLLTKYDEMYEAFTGEIDRLKLAKQDATDLERTKEEQIDTYNTYIINLQNRIKQLETKQIANVPPVHQETPTIKSETPIIKNGECTNCPKVVESHTRTIYEYPPAQQVQPCVEDEC